jgi:hypothetical protein
MSYTPGEKAVLAQLRHLYSSSMVREQQVKVLVTQWPASHVETYSKAFQAMITAGFVDHTGGQTFTITDAGLLAIGAPIPTPPVTPPVAVKKSAPLVVQEPPQKRSGFLARLLRR